MQQRRMRRAAAGAVSDGSCAALKHFDSLPDSAFVNSAVVRLIYGVTGEATLWKWWKAGRIPTPRKLAGSSRNSWNVGELRRALAGARES